MTESSDEAIGGEENQPIYMHLFLNDKLGSKVLQGTTSDDPALLARVFCRKWNLGKQYYRAIKDAVFEK